ncbi:hypothetical protein [Lentibacter sp. XHP0401]|uniref:hypothetical protein n=1 Tax=Lentibacter sp. XHP0401 TaxID=2984334 RepID=UPI0021E96B5A|nr:hypothetical protein [Lentibacter sp. XHP0401]MCV2893922.1 hypothetical protein [Lentibacter sp. XHP0401]
MSNETLTYTGGAEEILARWNKRRGPFKLEGAAYAPDLDLATLAGRIVPESAAEPKGNHGTFALKRSMIAPEFIGLSELAFLNAQLIAHLRRSIYPPEAPALFRRLWAEHPEHLLGQLDLRWQVSSAMTFADHGQAGPEQALGASLKMLFGLIKLYEFERLFTGLAPSEIHRFGSRSKAAMPLKMDQYSLNHGGLDVALLAPLYAQAEDAPVLKPLALTLLHALNAEGGTIFRRLDTMKERRAKARSKKENRV